jgi:hypothetical protein
VAIALAYCALVLLIGGLLLYLGGWVGLWIEAFRRSIWWGLAVFLVPVITIFFALRYWKQVKLPALSVIIGLCLIGVGYLIVAGLGIEH